jgi:hypothetical protein
MPSAARASYGSATSQESRRGAGHHASQSHRHRHRRSLSALATLAAVGVLLTGCTAAGKAGEADTASGKGAKDQTVDVGPVYSRTGLLAAYGKQYRDDFMAGLDYATKSTGKWPGTASRSPSRTTRAAPARRSPRRRT